VRIAPPYLKCFALCNDVVGAMSHLPILDPEEEEKLSPTELSDVLIKRVLAARKAKVCVNDQYKVDYQEALKDVQHGKVEWPLKPEEMTRRRTEFLRESHARGVRHLNYNVADSVVTAAGENQAPGTVQEEGLNMIHESEEIEELKKLETTRKVRDDGF
jgi:hypothetical protein